MFYELQSRKLKVQVITLAKQTSYAIDLGKIYRRKGKMDIELQFFNIRFDHRKQSCDFYRGSL